MFQRVKKNSNKQTKTHHKILTFLGIPIREKQIKFAFIDNIKKLQEEKISCGNNKQDNKGNVPVLGRGPFT